MPNSRFNLAEVLGIVRAFVLDTIPDAVLEDLEVRLAGGRKLVIPFPAPGITLDVPTAGRSATTPVPDLTLGLTERNIVEAIGRGNLRGEEVAERSGYPYDAYLRSNLAALRRKGILGGEKGEPGYWVLDPDRWGVPAEEG